MVETKMTIKPPSRPQSIEEFLAMADKNPTPAAPDKPKKKLYPWEAPGVKESVKKSMLITLSEPDWLKLEWIKDETGKFKQGFASMAASAAIADEIERLTNKGDKGGEKDENQ